MRNTLIRDLIYIVKLKWPRSSTEAFQSPQISREHVGKLACLRAQSAAAAGCEARSAEHPADGNTLIGRRGLPYVHRQYPLYTLLGDFAME